MQRQHSSDGGRITPGHPRGGTTAWCPSCNCSHPGTRLSRTRCGRCRCFLPYGNGSGSVSCPTCRILQQLPDRLAQIVCGGCQTTLTFLVGPRAVRCPRCRSVTDARSAHRRILQSNPTNGAAVSEMTSSWPISAIGRVPQVNQTSGTAATETASPSSLTQRQCPYAVAVLIENPMTFDSDGKPVRNIAVGVRANKKNQYKKISSATAPT